MNAARPHTHLSHATAQELAQAARQASAEIGFSPAIAIADAGGHLRWFERADAAAFLTAEVAINKAWTAAAYGLPTSQWADILRNPAVAHLAQVPRLMAVGGGYPIVIDGNLIGGIGISGGSAEEDQRAAERALQQLGLRGETA